MKIAVVTIAYSSPASAASVIETASSANGHAVECHLFLHSKYPQLVEACNRIAQSPSVVYYPFGANRGVAKCWNEGMLAAYAARADVVIIANGLWRPSDFPNSRLNRRGLPLLHRGLSFYRLSRSLNGSLYLHLSRLSGLALQFFTLIPPHRCVRLGTSRLDGPVPGHPLPYRRLRLRNSGDPSCC